MIASVVHMILCNHRIVTQLSNKIYMMLEFDVEIISSLSQIAFLLLFDKKILNIFGRTKVSIVP